MDPDAARAYERDTLRRVADLALLPPQLNTNPLPEYAYENLDYGMTIGIERSPGGRLFVVWVGGEDGPKAFFLLATSDDGGDTWSQPRLVIHSDHPQLPLPRSVIIGNPWCDPLGRLWLFFDQTMRHFDGRSGLWASRCDQPDADELVWTKPERIWHGSMLNKPLVLSDGTWLLFDQLLQNGGYGPFKGLFPELDNLRGVNVLASSDQGATWQRRGRAVVDQETAPWLEPMAVERRDGSLWMMIRTRGSTVETVSHDGGRTWSPTQPTTNIRQTSARFFLRRLASGRILLVKNGPQVDAIPEHHRGRDQFSAWLSDDDGKSWQGGLILDDRDQVSYPDGFQAPDGRIYISYDRKRTADGHILLARFTEEDVLAGRIVSPGSRLQQLIVRPLKNVTES
ncbi:MAG: sialidase family protein [Candidatus Sumerlaeota bacterium]